MEDNTDIIIEKKKAKKRLLIGIALFAFALLLPFLTYMYGYITGQSSENESGLRMVNYY